MTLTDLHHTAAIPRPLRRRAQRPAAERGDRATAAERYDALRAHGMLLAVLIGLAAATVAYAIVRETPVAFALMAPIALQIRWAATALRLPERTGDEITFVP